MTRAFALARTVIEVLDPYADPPHQDGRHEALEHHVGVRDVDQPVGASHTSLDQEGEEETHDHGVSHSLQVDERGETEHPVVGMEHPESSHIENEVEAEGAKEVVEDGECRQHTLVEDIDEESAEQEQQAVK